MKVDRASMACSLEVRAPFLDVELVEFLGRVPARLKLRRLRDEAPPQARHGGRAAPRDRDRAKKGFGIPVAEWFKGDLREALEDELSPERLRAPGALRAGRGPAARLRAHERPPRPPQAAVDALRLPALAPALARAPPAAHDPFPSEHEESDRRGPRLPAVRRSLCNSSRANRATTSTLSGELVCAGCARRWPIRRGIPRLVPPELVEQQRRTARAFGWQWQHFSEMHREFEEQFLDWLHPITPEFFRASACSTPGAAPAGTLLRGALRRTRGLRARPERRRGDRARQSRVVRQRPRRPGRPPPAAVPIREPGRRASTSSTRSGSSTISRIRTRASRVSSASSGPAGRSPSGCTATRTTASSGNVVEPLRRISTKMPPPLLRALAWPLAAGFHGVAKGVYRPLHGTAVGRALPLDEYLSSVADFSFRQNYGIVFDQLVAPTAAYIRGPSSRAGSRRAGSRTSRSRIGTATHGAATGRVPADDGRQPRHGRLLELVACPTCRANSRPMPTACAVRSAAGMPFDCTRRARTDDGEGAARRPSALARLQYAVSATRASTTSTRPTEGVDRSPPRSRGLRRRRRRSSTSAPARAWWPASFRRRRATCGWTTTR